METSSSEYVSFKEYQILMCWHLIIRVCGTKKYSKRVGVLEVLGKSAGGH